MNNMLKNFKEWFESEDGQKSIRDFEKNQNFNNELKQKYFNKFNNLTSEERKIIIKKINDKYESDKYINREYKIGYFPRKELLNLLFDYSSEYGKPYYINCMFPNEAYIIDDNIIFEMIFGQGSECFVHFK